MGWDELPHPPHPKIHGKPRGFGSSTPLTFPGAALGGGRGSGGGGVNEELIIDHSRREGHWECRSSGPAVPWMEQSWVLWNFRGG